MIIGIVAALYGLGMWLATGNEVSQCRSLLVQMFASHDCSQATLAHNAGILFAIFGTILAISAAWMRAQSSRNRYNSW